jgi:transcriptional regulator with XRE-family HTH domain
LFNHGGELYLDIQREFGLRIRQLRKESGMSQEKFALSIDMDRTYLASIEAGKRNPALQNIKKIADGLGISLSDLFLGL